MSKSQKLAAIQMILDGFRALYDAEEKELEKLNAPVSIPEKAQEEKPEESAAEKVVEPVEEKKDSAQEKPVEVPEEEKPEESPVEEESEDDLESMTDTELKALAKDMGIKVILGMKRQKILDAVRAKIAEENKKKIAQEKSTPTNKPVPTKTESEELPEDDLMKKLRETTEDMTDDELREILEEAEISVKGGRTALLSKLYDAVKKGVIELDNDEEEETVTEEDAEDAIISAEEKEEDTPARLKAIEDFEKENRQAFEDGELEVSDMKAFLKENFDITVPKKATPVEVLDEYINHAVNFIDDEGNTVEEGAYCVRGVPYCCGVPLEVEKDKAGNTVLKCNICGEAYEMQED